VNRSRINFELDISDYQEHLVYFDLEADSSKPLLRHIPVEDGIVLDIGANIGQTALWIANCLKKKNVKIIAFEPYPSTYAKLERNVSLNKFSIRLENMALGNKDDKIVMVQECSTNSGGASAYNPNMNSLCHPVEVVQTRLDTYLANSNDRVTLIKIDVEGYECQVLQGAEETIKRHRPTLFVELADAHLKRQGYSASALVDLIKSFGYRSVQNVQTLRSIEEECLGSCHIDILCRR